MDLSKLPKLSQTTQRTDPIEPGSQAPASQLPAEPTAFCPACGSPLRASARFCDSCGAPTRTPAGRAQAGAEAWISIAIAAILLFLFPNLMVYLFHPGTTRFDATDTGTGASIPYAHSAFIWPDVGVTFFCFVLILDAVLMLILPKRGVVMLAFALAILCAALNLFVIIKSMDILGFQVVCAIAVAFSIYIAIQRWSNFRSM